MIEWQIFFFAIINERLLGSRCVCVGGGGRYSAYLIVLNRPRVGDLAMCLAQFLIELRCLNIEVFVPP